MRWLAMTLVFVAVGAQGQPAKPFFLEEEYEAKPWKEIESQLPPFPTSGKLLKFPVTPSNFEFFIDADSLGVGSDGVVRFSLVARSTTGAENITFEGMRCFTGERRTYAFGHSDKTWSKARSNKWAAIGSANRAPQFATLWNDYFCPAGFIIANPKEGLDALRWGVHPRARP